MSSILIAQEGDTLDLLLWRDAGLGSESVAAVLAANQNLAKSGAVLPRGTQIIIPDDVPTTKTSDVVQLWD